MKVAVFALMLLAGSAAADRAADELAPNPFRNKASEPVPAHTGPRRPPGPGDQGGLENPFARGARAQLPVAPKPAAMPVSPEIAKLGKQLAGTYTCKGVNLRGDGSSTPM